MSRVTHVPGLQPNSLEVIEDSKKVQPVSSEEILEVVNHFQTKVDRLEHNTGAANLSREDKEPLIRMSDEIENTLNDLSQDPSFPNLDTVIMRKMILALEKQRKIRQNGEKMNLSELLFQQKRQEGLNDEFMNVKKEVVKTQKTAKGFKDAQIVTGIILAGCVLATLITGGGAGALIPLALGTAGVANGAATIGKSVFDHQKEKQSGELVNLSFQREEISGNIHDEMESVADAVRGVMRSWDDLRELLSKRNDAMENLY